MKKAIRRNQQNSERLEIKPAARLLSKSLSARMAEIKLLPAALLHRAFNGEQ